MKLQTLCVLIPAWPRDNENSIFVCDCGLAPNLPKVCWHLAQSSHTMVSKAWVGNANAAVARSAVGRYFRLEGSGHVS